MKKRIAILFHENEKKLNPGYLITYFADIWRERGNEVIFLFGVKEYVPADLIIVHVDLSVVPDEYLEFARKYPIVLNGEAKDIRKSSFSKNLIGPDDHYEGKVIIKSNLNYGGLPEQRLLHPQPRRRSRFLRIFPRFLFRCAKKFPLKRSPINYRIYNRLHSVPRSCFNNPDWVVEKFLPEKKNGLYHIRFYSFLGDCKTCLRLASKKPIVKIYGSIKIEEIEPHPEVIKLRKKMKFDYGKFDYVVHNGEFALLDINKTIGTGFKDYPSKLKGFDNQKAAGIYSYLSSSV